MIQILSRKVKARNQRRRKVKPSIMKKSSKNVNLNRTSNLGTSSTPRIKNPSKVKFQRSKEKKYATVFIVWESVRRNADLRILIKNCLINLYQHGKNLSNTVERHIPHSKVRSKKQHYCSNTSHGIEMDKENSNSIGTIQTW